MVTSVDVRKTKGSCLVKIKQSTTRGFVGGQQYEYNAEDTQNARWRSISALSLGYDTTFD